MRKQTLRSTGCTNDGHCQTLTSHPDDRMPMLSTPKCLPQALMTTRRAGRLAGLTPMRIASALMASSYAVHASNSESYTPIKRTSLGRNASCSDRCIRFSCPVMDENAFDASYSLLPVTSIRTVYVRCVKAPELEKVTDRAFALARASSARRHCSTASTTRTVATRTATRRARCKRAGLAGGGSNQTVTSSSIQPAPPGPLRIRPTTTRKRDSAIVGTTTTHRRKHVPRHVHSFMVDSSSARSACVGRRVIICSSNSRRLSSTSSANRSTRHSRSVMAATTVRSSTASSIILARSAFARSTCYTK